MASPYEPSRIAEYFDELGEGEWDRLERDSEAEVNFAIHLHYLRRYVQPGWRVLEVGAGAGRFTVELARLGCSVLATDISPVQLDLNRKMLDEAGLGDAVEDRLLVDVVDMSPLDDDAFDAVVCYGGPLSYAMDQSAAGLQECVRVAKPGGPLLISVMSLWGSVHKGLSFVMAVPPEANEAIVASGDITPDVLPGHRHICHAFRGTEFRDLLVQAGLTIEAMSASTCLCTAWGERLTDIRADEARWEELLQMELDACAEAGCVEAGPHIIAVVSKPVGK